jgi:probable HAF family extracellular repeat protein
MKNLMTMGLVLLALSLAGCNGSGLQPSAAPSAIKNSAIDLGKSAASYTVTDLGTLGGTLTYPEAINNRGAVSGISTLAGDAVVRGFLWEKDRLIDVGALPAGPNSQAFAVNERLQVVGKADGATTQADSNVSCFTASALDSHAFLWQRGRLTDLGTLGGNTSIGFVPNNRAQITGISQIQAVDPNGFVACGGHPGSQIVRAFLYEDGKMTDLGTLGGFDSAADTINDSGQVGGGSDITKTIDHALGYPHHHPFVWTRGVMTDLGTLGGEFGYSSTVTNKGTAVGFTTLLGEQHGHGFLWEHGVMSDLGVLGGDTDSGADWMNNVGQIVGFSSTSSTMRAFIRQNGVMTDLNTLISPNSGFQLAEAVSINDAGEIAAGAIQQSTGDVHAVLLTPSDKKVRGKAGGAPLTERLRRYLLQRYGYRRMPFLLRHPK